MADCSSVLLFSAGNPDATFLAAALLHRDYPGIDLLLHQGSAELQPSPAAAIALAEFDRDCGVWQARYANPAFSGPIDVGITLCVPT